MQDPLDGQMVAGAFRDNAVVPYAGVCAAGLSEGQRRRLRALVATYVGWVREGHSGVKMSDVERHLDETYFAWMGAVDDDGPFYYRVHRPLRADRACVRAVISAGVAGDSHACTGCLFQAGLPGLKSPGPSRVVRRDMHAHNSRS
jgi:hypothetical protein